MDGLQNALEKGAIEDSAAGTIENVVGGSVTAERTSGVKRLFESGETAINTFYGSLIFVGTYEKIDGIRTKLKTIASQTNSDRLALLQNYTTSFLRYVIGSFMRTYSHMAQIATDIRRTNEKTAEAYRYYGQYNSDSLKIVVAQGLDGINRLSRLLRQRVFRQYVGGYQTEKEVKRTLLDNGYRVFGKSNFVNSRNGALLATLDFSRGAITPLNGHDISPISSILERYNFTLDIGNAKYSKIQKP